MEVMHNHICLFLEGREEAQGTEQGEEGSSQSQPITRATKHLKDLRKHDVLRNIVTEKYGLQQLRPQKMLLIKCYYESVAYVLNVLWMHMKADE